MNPRTLSLIAMTLIVTLIAASTAATPDRVAPNTEVDENGMLSLTVQIPLRGANDGTSPDGHSASCGNTAPLIRMCSDILGATHAGSLLITTTVMPGYTGAVTNSGSSSTGSYTWTCDLFAYPLSYYCPPISSSGFFLVGQSILLQGETSSASVGVWEVSLENM